MICANVRKTLIETFTAFTVVTNLLVSRANFTEIRITRIDYTIRLYNIEKYCAFSLIKMSKVLVCVYTCIISKCRIRQDIRYKYSGKYDF